MKKITYLYAFVFVYVTFLPLYAQESRAIKEYNNQSYAVAQTLLLKLANNGNASPEIIEKLANTYYFNGDLEEASRWYEDLIIKKSKVDPETYFMYSQTLKSKEDYKKANEMLALFAKSKPEDSRAKAYLETPDYLDKIGEYYEDFNLSNSENMNTAFSDFGGVLNNGEFYIASTRDEGKIDKRTGTPFLSMFKIANKDSVEEVLSDFNIKYHESSPTFTKDGKTIYFTRSSYNKNRVKKNVKGEYVLYIYQATLGEEVLENVKPLPFNNINYNVTHPALNGANDKLYFASDMPGGYGGSDIYVVERSSNGVFGKPENLGPKVNTEGRESFPYVSQDSILYFSSDGHLGLGGKDVFKIPVDSLETGTAKNLGKPINSPKDDIAFSIYKTQNKAYVSSNRKGGKGKDDIYGITIIPCTNEVEGLVVDKATRKPLSEVAVTVYDSDDNEIETFTTDKTGVYTLSLPCSESTYKVEGKKAEYEDDTVTFTTVKDRSEIESILALKALPPPPKKDEDLFVKLDLKPIYFDYGKANVREDGKIELDKIVDYMKKYPTVKISVRSHTDSRSSSASNLKLSNRRNKATKDYIINEGGISADRITGRGYGEYQLKNGCKDGVPCSEEEHQENRRSEFIVLSL